MSKEEKKIEKTEEVVEEETPIEENIEDIKKDEEEIGKDISKPSFDVSSWDPKTSIGKKVKSGEISDINDILNKGDVILEAEIVDVLIPDLQTDLLLIGQSKGKFGGGQRRVFKQTQKKTKEGNKPKFATYGVVGNGDGIIGLGYGKSKETVPAREKAIRNAKLNIFKIRRGSGSWESSSNEATSIPFKVSGKCGSCIMTLIPAPKGTGLCVEKECQKVLKLAGISDIWSRTFGQTKTKTNMIKACENALRSLMSTKLNQDDIKKMNIIEGSMKEGVENE